MECLDGSLVSFLYGSGKVGEVRSYVGLNSALSEEEVIRASAKLLSADGNALNSNKHTYVGSEVGSFLKEFFGDINCLYSLLGGIDNLGYSTALDLHHAGVRSSGTCNANGHTNLEVKVSDGVLIHLIDVVTALTACINKEEVVSLITYRLGVHSGDNTLNNKSIAVFCSEVLFKSIYLELGNSAIKYYGRSVSFGVGDGCSELVSDVGASLFVYVNGNHLLVSHRTYGNTGGNVNGPNYVAGLVTNLDDANYFIVCLGSGGLVFVHCKEEFFRFFCCGLSSTLIAVVTVVGIVGVVGVILAAGCEATETKNKHKKQANDLFHFFFSFF